MPSLYGNNIVTQATCPQLQRSYRPTFYTTPNWGYAINEYWSVDGLVKAAGQNINNLTRPSAYPMFMDPHVYPWSSGWMAVDRNIPANAGPYFGLGTHHGNADRGNVLFGDGSVRAVEAAEIKDKIWYANR
ncbi:MAG: hypothetical protein HC898_05695 [Phycisphaerales bacterium]|nr:hypothetical protein [Phycisphaerales bacterium]